MAKKQVKAKEPKKPIGPVTQGDPKQPPAGGCGNGYIWSSTLERCIPDPG